jgi:hypothetical protein
MLPHAKVDCFPSDFLALLYKPGGSTGDRPFTVLRLALLMHVDIPRNIEDALDGRSDLGD